MLIMLYSVCFFFFFKQKTAYEMRISDWSSDVCSSDLHGGVRVHDGDGRRQVAEGNLVAAQLLQGSVGVGRLVVGVGIHQRAFLLEDRFAQQRDDVLPFRKPLAAQAPQDRKSTRLHSSH